MNPNMFNPPARDSIPRWKTSDIDEHVEEKVQAYEAARDSLEELITTLRARVKQLEAENERLKWELISPPVASPGCEIRGHFHGKSDERILLNRGQFQKLAENLWNMAVVLNQPS